MIPRRVLLVLSAVALVPAMTGPLRAADARALVLPLCNGGTVTIPIGGEHDGSGGQPTTPCCAKACHSGDRRKPLDRKQ